MLQEKGKMKEKKYTKKKNKKKVITKIQNFIFGNSVLLFPKHRFSFRYKIFSSNISLHSWWFLVVIKWLS